MTASALCVLPALPPLRPTLELLPDLVGPSLPAALPGLENPRSAPSQTPPAPVRSVVRPSEDETRSMSEGRYE